MRWLITETTEYLVEAPTKEVAERLFAEAGPEVDTAVLEVASVVETKIEPADS